LKHYNGDIWDLYNKGYYLIVPSNIGWTNKKHNVMGAGIAKDVKIKFPHIPVKYGPECQLLGFNIGITVYTLERLIMFPTKPLNIKKPHLSWQGNSTLLQIENSCKHLYTHVDEITKHRYIKNFDIAMPLVGCGNGGLKPDKVMPILEMYFENFDNITLVTR
jgi:hypothetical protein